MHHHSPRSAVPIARLDRAATIFIGLVSLAAIAPEEATALPLIDPITPTTQLNGVVSGGFFGHAAVTAGDLNADGFSDLIVGAPTYTGDLSNEGAFSVFLGSPAGTSLTPFAVREGNEAGARMGESVACLGDVNGDGFQDIAAGAINAGAGNEGQVQIYLGTPAGIAGHATRVLDGTQANAAFGASVAGAGDVNNDGFQDLLVGEYNFDNGQSNEGRALLYLGSASGIGSVPAWTFESNVANAQLGYEVSTAGDVNGDGRDDVIIGSFQFSNGQNAEGAAWAFLGTASGLASVPIWVTEGNQTGAHFGNAVANAGDVNGDGYADVLVGAPLFDNGQADEGRAYLFLGGSSGLASSPQITMESNVAGAQLGSSVGTAGDINGDGFADWVIGAPKITGDQTEEGKVFLHLGRSFIGSSAPAFTLERQQSFAGFGSAVGTAGDVDGDGFSDVVIGAPIFDGAGSNDGAVFVYKGAAGPPTSSPSWTRSGTVDESAFGFAAQSVGDVNGDGYDDAVVGEPYFEVGSTTPGRATLYLGSSSGLAATPSQSVTPASTTESFTGFGLSIARAGDVNGDGFDDVLIGGSSYDGLTGSDLGMVELWIGSQAGLVFREVWRGQSDNDVLGEAMAAADVNGDGFSDVILGYPWTFDHGVFARGRVRVFQGSPTGPDQYADWIFSGEQGARGFGSNVCRAGDVNGDGYEDVLIQQSIRQGRPADGRGFVSLYLGGEYGLGGAAAWTAEGEAPQEALGDEMNGIGDVNGDGFADVAVREQHGPAFAAGKVFVYLGNASGLPANPAFVTSGVTEENLGQSIACAGDVNDDGYSDLLLGSPSYWHQDVAGFASIYLGGPDGLAEPPIWIGTANEHSDTFGQSVSGAGDFNGDGFSDVIIGAPNTGPANAELGAAFAYYGNDGFGLDRTPMQRRAEGITRISTNGLTMDTASFCKVSALARSAAGRSDVKLRADFGTLGESWNGLTVTGPNVDTSVPDAGEGSATLALLGLAPLTPQAPYHWRLRLEGQNPFFPHSPWLLVQGNSPFETDFRPFAYTAAVEPGPGDARDVSLQAPTPNPTHEATTLSFTLREAAPIELRVHDVQGRVVRHVLATHAEAGSQSIVWDGRDDSGHRVASGTYFVRLASGAATSTRKIVLRK